MFGVFSYGQSFEIPKEEFPFYEIVEWKGKGALLISKDPTEKLKKINITLVGGQNKATWNQSFNPKGKQYYYLTGENSDYVYFMDNLIPEDGKYFFTQACSNGIVKTSSSVLTHIFGMVFKNIADLKIDKLELVDVVMTEKALVHIFRYYHERDKKYFELGVFMTHNNMISYACILGEVKEDQLRDEYMGHWKYIGSSGDKIYFAVRGYNKELKKGWLVSGYTPKAELISSNFVINSDLKYEPIDDKGFGLSGRNYLNVKTKPEPNVLTHVNGNFFLTGILTTNGIRELKTLKLKDNKWENYYSFPLKPVTKPKPFTPIGIFPLNEGLGIKLEQNSFFTAIFMPFDLKSGTSVTLYNDKILYNPSRMFLKEKKQDFGYMIGGKKIFFSYIQLNSKSNVKFEYIDKVL